MTQDVEEAAPGERGRKDDIKTKVVYPAARKPLELTFEPSATMGEVKQAVLNGFGIKEGATEDGKGTTSYTLFDGKDALVDLSATLGSIAGHAHNITLKLVQEITQG